MATASDTRKALGPVLIKSDTMMNGRRYPYDLNAYKVNKNQTQSRTVVTVKIHTQQNKEHNLVAQKYNAGIESTSHFFLALSSKTQSWFLIYMYQFNPKV